MKELVQKMRMEAANLAADVAEEFKRGSLLRTDAKLTRLKDMYRMITDLEHNDL